MRKSCQTEVAALGLPLTRPLRGHPLPQGERGTGPLEEPEGIWVSLLPCGRRIRMRGAKFQYYGANARRGGLRPFSEKHRYRVVFFSYSQCASFFRKGGVS